MQVYFFRLHNSFIPKKDIKKILETAHIFYNTAKEKKNEAEIAQSKEVFQVTIQILRGKGLVEEAVNVAIDFLKKEPDNMVQTY